MPNAYRLLAAALPIVFVVARPASGQSTPYRSTSDNGATWLAYTGVHPLREGSPWRLHVEGQLRQSPGVERPLGRLFRTALLHTLGASATTGAGYAFFRSYPYGGFSDEAPIADEHRIYEQLDLRHATGVLRFAHRHRLEQRWIEQIARDAAGVERRDGWRYVNRYRYQFRTTVQRHPNDVAQPYLTAYDELFIGFGRNVTGNVFDQNRAFAGAGYRWGDALRVEAGYLNQYVLRGNGREVEQNHTLFVGFASDAPLLR